MTWKKTMNAPIKQVWKQGEDLIVLLSGSQKTKAGDHKYEVLYVSNGTLKMRGKHNTKKDATDTVSVFKKIDPSVVSKMPNL
jgi:hypothetical protein